MIYPHPTRPQDFFGGDTEMIQMKNIVDLILLPSSPPCALPNIGPSFRGRHHHYTWRRETEGNSVDVAHVASSHEFRPRCHEGYMGMSCQRLRRMGQAAPSLIDAIDCLLLAIIPLGNSAEVPTGEALWERWQREYLVVVEKRSGTSCQS